ncbi:MAG: hypothetical protein WDO24_19080 [Pseudomonadota bacterium]
MLATQGRQETGQALDAQAGLELVEQRVAECVVKRQAGGLPKLQQRRGQRRARLAVDRSPVQFEFGQQALELAQPCVRRAERGRRVGLRRRADTRRCHRQNSGNEGGRQPRQDRERRIRTAHRL